MFPRNLGVINQRRDLVVSGLESRVLEKTFDIPLLGTIPKSVVTKSTLVPDPAAVISQVRQVTLFFYSRHYAGFNERILFTG
jgi:hypothetical protein